jgi:hypothetical protein
MLSGRWLQSLFVLGVLVFALLSGPTPHAAAQEPSAFTQADFMEQIRRNTMPNGMVRPLVVLLMVGSGVRGDDTEAIRKQVYEGIAKQRPDIANLIGVYAIPMTGKGKGHAAFFSDVATSVWRQAFGMDPQDMPVSPQEALGLVAKSGGKSFFVVAHSGAENAAREFMAQMLAATGGQLSFACINCAVTLEMKTLIEAANPSNQAVEWVPDAVTAIQQPGKDVVPLAGRNIRFINTPNVLLGNLLKTPWLISKFLIQITTGSPPHALYSDENIGRMLSDGFGLTRAGDDLVVNELKRQAQDQGESLGGLVATPAYVYDTADGPPPPTPNGGGAGVAASPDLGGVDFSQVELRYLVEGEADGGSFLASSVRGIPSREELAASPGEGAELTWNSFLVWLSLPNDTFWVNLNPNEPDRVIDSRLGQTEVGRVLLEADLQLKKDTAQLTDPRTDTGKAFWNGLDNCASAKQQSGNEAAPQLELSHRTWIVPGEVTVYSDANQVYVLDARLDVRLESEYAEVSGGDNAVETSEFRRCGEALLKELVLPELIDNVNTAPQYGELREVFYSRVVAEWYKDQHQGQGGLFGDLVDTGDVRAFPSQPGWTPQDTYDRYVKCVNPDETEDECGYNVTVEEKTQEGDVTTTKRSQYVSGGIDLTRIPLSQVSSDELVRQQPEAAEQVADAILLGMYPGQDDYWAGEALFVPGSSTDTPAVAPDEESSAVDSDQGRSPIVWFVGVGVVGVLAAVAGAGYWLFIRQPEYDDSDESRYDDF